MFFYKNIGRTAKLVLNVQWASSLVTLVFALFCFYVLEVKGTLFVVLLSYSVINIINVLLYFIHYHLEYLYNTSSILAFITTYLVCTQTGGVNSLFSVFLVLLVFFGYITERRYGKLWFIIAAIAIASLYIYGKVEKSFIDEVTLLQRDDFNFLSLLLFLLLFGWLFGSLVGRYNNKIRKASKQLKKNDEEKAVMLREIHHRVKNNLQLINSMLRIQSKTIADPTVKDFFSLAQSRIVTMARLHEKIYETENLKYIKANEYFINFINDLIKSYSVDDTEINYIVEVDKSLLLTIDVLLPLSLLINEIVTNSLKHAFHDVNSGEIYMSFAKSKDDKYLLNLSDNGSGFKNNSVQFSGLGKRLINSFVRQLQGSYEVASNTAGTQYLINF